MSAWSADAKRKASFHAVIRSKGGQKCAPKSSHSANFSVLPTSPRTHAPVRRLARRATGLPVLPVAQRGLVIIPRTKDQNQGFRLRSASASRALSGVPIHSPGLPPHPQKSTTPPHPPIDLAQNSTASHRSNFAPPPHLLRDRTPLCPCPNRASEPRAGRHCTV